MLLGNVLFFRRCLPFPPLFTLRRVLHHERYPFASFLHYRRLHFREWDQCANRENGHTEAAEKPDTGIRGGWPEEFDRFYTGKNEMPRSWGCCYGLSIKEDPGIWL